AVLFVLALASYQRSENLIGPFGRYLSLILIGGFGYYISFCIPAFLIYQGVCTFRGIKRRHPIVRVAGVILLLMSISALFTLPYARDPELIGRSFHAGGALGSFLTGTEGLRLATILGTVGAGLLFLALGLIGLLLATEMLLSETMGRVKDGLTDRVDSWRDHRAKKLASLEAFKRHVPNRIFGAADDEEGTAAVEDEDKSDPGDQRSDGPKIIEEDSEGNATTDSLALASEQQQLELFPHIGDYELPPLDLLRDPPKLDHRMTREEVLELSGQIEQVLKDFGIEAQVIQVTQGPVVTRFELQPAPGVKISRIVNLENDLAMVLKASQVRILAPIPGKAAVGIEVPNRKTSTVVLKEILATEEFRNHPSPLAFALGKTIAGENCICDLASMPHLLIAGTTGAGKSVCLNSIIVSILYHMSPHHVKFIMIDPKRVELNVFQAIPYLLAPVVSEVRKAAAALNWAVEEMEGRYKTLAAMGVRNIDSYNSIVLSREPHPKAMGRRLEYMPHIVIVIDELADLMLIARNEVEETVQRLAQMSRAVGIHLLIATQRPSVNVITGVIKANFPSRIAFKVSSKVDSRTILDMNGAEALLGKGDMLYAPGGIPKPIRIQGAYVSEDEVEKVTDFIRERIKAVYLKQDFVPKQEKTDAAESDQVDEDDADAEGGAAAPGGLDNEEMDDDTLYHKALRLILESKKASVSLIQRRMKIGYARAGRLMDMMEDNGVVGPYQGSKPRTLLVEPSELLARLDEIEREGEIAPR
ncbi:MAG: DNA translocase FtsK 4TM domain-containing protein, partial [bacterium]